MTFESTKPGRPRRYDLEAPPGFADSAVGLAAAALDELRARVIDQIADLPEVALTRVPENSTLSIAALVVHMVWAEMNWVSRITGFAPPEDLRTFVTATGAAVPAGKIVEPDVGAGDLVSLIHRVDEEVTRPALASLDGPDVVLPRTPSPMTPRGVLMHLIWHWTYHSGQVGLLRELAGYGYEWRFGALGKES